MNLTSFSQKSVKQTQSYLTTFAALQSYCKSSYPHMNTLLHITARSFNDLSLAESSIAALSATSTTLTAVTHFNVLRKLVIKGQPGGATDATSTRELPRLPITRSSLIVSVGAETHGGYFFL